MTLIFSGLFLILLVLIVRSSLGQPRLILKIVIHIIGGIVGLWICDLLLNVIGFSIPINIFTVILVGITGLPGVIVLAILQLLGI